MIVGNFKYFQCSKAREFFRELGELVIAEIQLRSLKPEEHNDEKLWT